MTDWFVDEIVRNLISLIFAVAGMIIGQYLYDRKIKPLLDRRRKS